MSRDVLVVLPLAALFLWLTLFLFTVIDHSIHRFSYGRFLSVLDKIERTSGGSLAGAMEIDRHMRGAKQRYLASYLARAGSGRASARIASEVYLERLGEATALEQASNFAQRRRKRQITALYALARTGHPKVLPLLEEAVGSSQPVLAYAALDMLDICDSVGAAEVLVRCIEEERLPASRIATHLEHFRTELGPLYVSRLSQENPKSRYWIAYLLGKSSYSSEAEELLDAMLADPEAGVRKVALASMASLGAPSVQARAESMLQDPAFFVRTQAVRVLAGFPSKEIVPVLVPMLRDSEDAVQLAVKKALLTLGSGALESMGEARAELDEATGAKLDEVICSIQHADRVDIGSVARA